MSRPQSNKEQHTRLVREIIRAIGDDPDREGVVDTPARVVKSWAELFQGYGMDPKDVCTVFEEGDGDMVVCRGIEFFSFCEHHMLPFFGTASIGYIPGEDNKVIGLSKLARITDIYARRLQIQERMGKQIADALEELINPKGVAVVIDAKHTCMCGRGVGKQRAMMTTSRMRGFFRDNPEARAEMLTLLRMKTQHD